MAKPCTLCLVGFLFFGYVFAMENQMRLTQDPHCSHSHCRKPTYDVLDSDTDCRDGKTYANCLRAVLRRCQAEYKNVKDDESVDELVSSYDAARNLLAVSGPGCYLQDSVGTLGSPHLKPTFSIAPYLSLAAVAMLLTRIR